MAFKIYKPSFENNTSKEFSPDEIYANVPIYRETDKVVIFDLDILAYRCSAACESKYLFTKHLPYC